MATLRDNLAIAFHSVGANRLRSASTVLGIVVGVAAVIAISGALVGLSKSITSNISSLGSGGLTVRAYTPLDEQLRGRENHLSIDDYDVVRRVVGERAVVSPVLYPFGFFGTTVRAGAIAYPTRVVATLSDYQEMAGSFPAEGRFISEGDVASRRRVCVLGADLAAKLKIHSPIDSYVEIGGDWFRVVGQMEPRGDVLGISQDDYVVIPYSVGEGLAGSQNEQDVVIDVSVKPTIDVETIQDDLMSALRRSRMRKREDPSTFEVKTAKQLRETVDSITRTAALALSGVVGISVLVSGVSVMNMMIVSVTERTREIGVAKSLGATRSDILVQFLAEALLMCGIGGVAGMGVGLALVGVMSMVSSSVAISAVPGWAYALALAFSIGIGALFGVVPALKAANLEPVEALRFE